MLKNINMAMQCLLHAVTVISVTEALTSPGPEWFDKSCYKKHWFDFFQ